MIKKILFLIFSILLFISALLYSVPPETELMQAFISPDSVLEKNIVKLASLSSKRVNIIFEGESLEEVESLKADFPQNNTNFQDVIEIYKNYPANFLSDKKRELIKEKNYNELERTALEGIYNPFGFYPVPINQDPYLLSTDFVTQLAKFAGDSTAEYNGKYYAISHLDIQNDSDIKELAKKAEHKSVYLTGTPIHSYFTSAKSNIEINIICIISSIALILLCKFYFKSFKIVLPIILSILFGFMFGYSFSALIFQKLHILTFVFSTSLIGISLDYSLHYFLTGDETGFKKSLTSSMVTTVLAFSALLFSNIEVLRQIAVFTSFGLFGVYLFVLIILPLFKVKQGFAGFKRIKVPKRAILILVIFIIVAGSFRLNFNDNIRSFYSPPKNLAYAESLYKKVFNPPNPEFIILSGNSIDEIIERQEELNLKDALGLANFISSKSRQNENISLVKTLYKEDWKNYQKLLGFELKEPEYKVYDTENFPLNKEFMLDKNTGFVMVNHAVDGSINIPDEISGILKRLRLQCLKLLPAVFIILFVFLSFIYGIKNAAKISLSPLVSVIFTVALLSLAGESINLFNILALFLIIGFSLDYSIFRLNSGEKSKDAVFMSALSTAFSFFLLSFTGFKLINSLASTLCIGITCSYILSLFMIKSKHEQEKRSQTGNN